MAPIIGVGLRYRSKWEICSDDDLIFTFLLKHKGYLRKKSEPLFFMVVTLKYFAYLGSDFPRFLHSFRSGSDLAPIFLQILLLSAGKIHVPNLRKRRRGRTNAFV